ncbi:hypothetical protein [Desulfobacter vibrioformis]|uniref:hypothetical protein n=1 Tax=Desulfobacter vibrioformis TaxID=34031 RepID=UPI00055839C2|nr:hypothetical protein [Desulfobacter vibrioformis]
MAACKDVKFVITNDRAQEIKILKAQYYDTEREKWRTEDFGPWKIASKTTDSSTENLEYVKNQEVKIKIEWKYNTGGMHWSDAHTTEPQVIPKCSGGQTVKFIIT